MGQPMRLDDFQKRFLLEIYDNPAGTDKWHISALRVKTGKQG